MSRILLFLFLLLPACVWAQGFTFETVTVPFPGASLTTVTGRMANQDVVGSYLDAEGRMAGFLRHDGQFYPFPLLTPRASTPDGQLVGNVTFSRLQGFLLREGSTRLLAGPVLPTAPRVAHFAEALGIAPSGLFVVGHYASGTPSQTHAFIYSVVTQQYTTITDPGATQTSLVAMNAGEISVGQRTLTDGTRQLIRVEAGIVTVLTLPASLTAPSLVAIAADETLAGNAGNQGFVLQGGVVEPVAVPGADLTELSGRQEDGVVYGRFLVGGVQQGFLGTPVALTTAPKDRKPRPPKTR